MAMLFFSWIVIANRGTALDRASGSNCACTHKQVFNQRRFARTALADKGNGADLLSVEIRHLFASSET
jgi:hypothetical protein